MMELLHIKIWKVNSFGCIMVNCLSLCNFSTQTRHLTSDSRHLKSNVVQWVQFASLCNFSNPSWPTESWHLTLDTRHQTPDTTHHTPHIWHLIPDTWHQTPDTWQITPDNWHLNTLAVQWVYFVSPCNFFMVTWKLTPDTKNMIPNT